MTTAIITSTAPITTMVTTTANTTTIIASGANTTRRYTSGGGLAQRPRGVTRAVNIDAAPPEKSSLQVSLSGTRGTEIIVEGSSRRSTRWPAGTWPCRWSSRSLTTAPERHFPDRPGDRNRAATQLRRDLSTSLDRATSGRTLTSGDERCGRTVVAPRKLAALGSR
jgi:hypothetical protein